MRSATATEGSDDQPEIDQVTLRLGGEYARMTALEAHVIAETRAILKPDQIERADQLFQRMPLMLLLQNRMGNPGS